MQERAMNAPASDVLVVENDTIVAAESVAAAPVAVASSTLEGTPEQRYEARLEQRHEIKTEPRYEANAGQNNEAPAKRGNDSLMDLVAPALAQPTEWSAPQETPAAVEPHFRDVAAAEHPVAAQASLETPAESAGEIAPQASASIVTPAAASDEVATHSAPNIGEVAAVSTAAEPVQASEDARVAADEESAIRAETEAVANWEAASSADSASHTPAGEAHGEPESANAPTAAGTIGAPAEEIPTLMNAAGIPETLHAAPAEPAHVSATDAATIAANALLASFGGGEASLPNRAASLAPASSAPAAAPEAAQTPQPSVDELVAKVLERLGPQLQEILANGLVRPLVEGLLNQQKPPSKKE
jgi:hypothetical protein